jgi:outer membrane protein OmpA-like peptidoglycan-associated protein
MRNSFAVLCAVSVLTTSAIASAQEVSLRGEPGVAVLLNGDTKYLPGGSVSLRPELTLGKFVGLGPSVSYTELTTPSVGVNNEHIWGFGGFLRVKRPFDNASKGILAMSPWVDADAQWVYTERSSRAGASAAIGVYAPLSSSREVWMGPFVRYMYVNQETDAGGLNPTSTNALIFGWGIELGRNQSKTQHTTNQAGPATPDPLKVLCDCCCDTKPAAPAQPEQSTVIKVERVSEVVLHFNFNSADLGVDEKDTLARVAHNLDMVDSYDHITVQGFASSDGSVSYNLALSKQRAQAVVNALVADGVPANTLSAEGFGIANPVGDNKTKEGRAENRRAEFVVKFLVSKRVKVPVKQ